MPLHRATTETPIGSEAPGPASTKIGFRSRWVLVVCLAALGLAGWWYRDAVRPYVEPLLQTVGVAPAAPDAPTTTPAASEQPTEDNVVRLDADGQGRLGLAFGQAETRRVILPVRTTGMVAFDERRVTRLKPRTSGRVLSLAVQPGDRVECRADAGHARCPQVFLDARNGLAAAQASLGEAQATEKVAETNLKRGSDLVKLGGVAQAEVDRRQVDLAKAHAATLSAKSQVDLYQAQYERLAPAPGQAPGTSAIVSPIDGVVTMAGITPGRGGRHQPRTPSPWRIRRIIQVLANLYGHDIATVKAGDRATIEAPVTAHPRFEGRVRSVNAAIDPMTNTAPGPPSRSPTPMGACAPTCSSLSRSPPTSGERASRCRPQGDPADRGRPHRVRANRRRPLRETGPHARHPARRLGRGGRPAWRRVRRWRHKEASASRLS